MTTQKALLTAEDLLDLPDDGKLYELLDGELVEMTPPGGGHGKHSARTAQQLLNFVDRTGAGEVLSNDVGVILRRNPDRVRGADVCFIARERIPVGGIPRGYLEIVPDFVIEVVSPGDRASEVEAKMEEWIRAGARLAWAMYPDTRSIVAYQSLSAVRVFAETEIIDAAPVLPDFSIRVADLFS